jgi:D-alanyl-lipoteichoic acid acyltransferase DltB (MBOAT superfamily)
MWFNSIEFLIFFLVTYSIYWVTPFRFQKYVLLVASFYFYAYWSIGFFLHFLSVTILSFWISDRIRIARKYPAPGPNTGFSAKEPGSGSSQFAKARAWMVIGVGLNLFNLCFFKYTQSILNGLFGNSGTSPDSFFSSIPEIILPLAISFYSFQIIAFIIDSYRGEAESVSFLDYILFIFFFPQLIAGPIMRHSDFFFQLNKRNFSSQDAKEAILKILSGVFKKVLIADQMARLINPIWANPSEQTLVAVLIAILGFSIQVYCDFSGYTDIARGCALLLGYRIPENFRAPYFSISFTELWTRWHITLSTWLRDYLYIPLGGNRVSAKRHQWNTILVMGLGGIWHGNTYTFLLWGLAHAIFLILERRIGKFGPESSIWGKLAGWSIVTLGWHIGVFFFRSGNWETMVGMIHSMGNLGSPKIFYEQFFSLVFLCYGIQYLQYKNFFQEKMNWNWNILVPVLSVLLYFAIARISIVRDQFIYFQF